jgi:dihydrofolate reductase
VAIKKKFAKKFWLVGGADIIKTIAQAKLSEVVSFARFRDLCLSQML